MKKQFLTLLCAMALSTNTFTAANATSLINGLGGPSGFGEGFLLANDDSSTGYIDLFSIFPDGLNMYGKTYYGLYVNNNGNVTFDDPSSQWEVESLADVENVMIAPFFVDVDTRNGSVTPTAGGTSTGSNLVWYDIDTVNNRFIATWDDVGHYDQKVDLLNAFQLVIENGDSNGSFEMKFIYEDLNYNNNNWAVAGFTSGDGYNYYELPESGTEDMLSLDDCGCIFSFNSSPNPVPEPSTMILGLMGLGGTLLRRKKFGNKN